ncbi:TadE/TadG family type IV pilus assembly protein [Wukongibacter sp. M2B1]|uniref:TadE/TadG family type IV pilus assembly protein n=1 Tax=Wukongibacter sp. M2B1 TaxID=3088895 RepID=UPI003D7A6724
MNKMSKRSIGDEGSLTVEASLIFPIITLAIVTVIYICMLLYQHAHLNYIANNVAERGAACWSNISKMKTSSNTYRLGTGELQSSKELLGSDLYWRIFRTKEKDKIKILKTYALDKLKSNNILEGEVSEINANDMENSKDNIDIWLKDYVVYKELNVVINNSYKIPLGDNLRIFGLEDTYNISVHSKAVINDPMEFIRNADFIGDTLKEFEKTKKILESFKETMDKINKNIEKFLQGIGGKTS